MKRLWKLIPKSSFLLLSILIFIFGGPILDRIILFPHIKLVLYSLIFLGTFSILEKKTFILKSLLYIGLSFNIFIFFFDIQIFSAISFGFSAIVFTIITFVLIFQIAASKRFDSGIIIEAIIGYLLIGLVSTLLNSFLLEINHEAIKFAGKAGLSDIIYYSYITLTTIGYGDISPQSYVAKSISIFTGLAGQLYLTIIIAFIIGKVSNYK